MKSRPNKQEYYMNIAREIAKRSPCRSRRQFGAIIVKDDAILSTGYNGSARGCTNCGEEIACLKDLHNEKSYISYVYCPAVHAEINAIVNSARQGVPIVEATMYLDVIGKAMNGSRNEDQPCAMCRRAIINAGLRDIHYRGKDKKIHHISMKELIQIENEWISQSLNN